MDEFVEQSSIAGVQVFHTSQPKSARILWLFMNFLAFILIAFYVFNIYTRYKLEPEFSYEFSQIALHEIPFPAVTICSPHLGRNQTVNLREFLKNPTQNLTAQQQNQLAAIIQACAPNLGSKIDKFCPLADTRKIIKILKSKFLSAEDGLGTKNLKGKCGYLNKFTNCSKIMNYVLTDNNGFCFSFNLESFLTIFNTQVISNDFKCFSKTGKIAKNLDPWSEKHKKKINETNQKIDWTLEKGYLTTSKFVLPVRSLYRSSFSVFVRVNNSDLAYLCPNMKRYFSIYYHMPNEIITPFHRPYFLKVQTHIRLQAKLYKTDESLRPYSPQKRNCYFEGERKLKYFKSYTKFHCEFECLANYTLAQCGCVKFSMPRENSTKICGLKETTCYIRVAKNWNLTCDCLNPCTYIKYKIGKGLLLNFQQKPTSFEIRSFYEEIFGEKEVISGVYNIYQGFADFGGMLGTIFGASLISFMEIIYFLALNLFRKKSNRQESRSEVQVSEFASSSTIHGIQFIFDKSKQKLERIFWILAFIFAFSCCIYNSRESYWKLNVVPETESTESFISAREIPFPALTLCSPFNVRKGLLPKHINAFLTSINSSHVTSLNTEQFYYLFANYYWLQPGMLPFLSKQRSMLVENIKDYDNHRFEVDLFPYLNRSHPEVDELFFTCKLGGISVQCSKLLKKVMNIRGICYTFNMQSYKEIFKERISKNFDSYGKYDKQQDPQWSLDKGYFINKTNQHPVRAVPENILELKVKIDKSDFRSLAFYYLKFYFNLPNEILTYVPNNVIFFGFEKLIKISAKLKQAEDKLRKFSPENRGCYFQDEIKLRFFNSYTRSNCILECLTKYLQKRCNCVAYLLPHDNLTKICESAVETKCYYSKLINFPPPYYDDKNFCGCLPTCNDIQYSSREAQLSNNTYKDPYSCRIRFQFESSKVVKIDEIRVAFGLQNFLTNVGGFLGLYLGCSVVSVFEVFYFFFTFLSRKILNKNGFKEEKCVQLNFNNNGLTLVEVFDFEEYVEA